MFSNFLANSASFSNFSQWCLGYDLDYLPTFLPELPTYLLTYLPTYLSGPKSGVTARICLWADFLAVEAVLLG